jgi:hypothetical protein
MEITMTLPFLTMTTSEGAGNFVLFLGFSLFWIAAIFVYTGLSSVFTGIISAVT